MEDAGAENGAAPPKRGHLEFLYEEIDWTTEGYLGAKVKKEDEQVANKDDLSDYLYVAPYPAYIGAFDEPYNPDKSNISVIEAVTIWPQFMKKAEEMA